MPSQVRILSGPPLRTPSEVFLILPKFSYQKTTLKTRVVFWSRYAGSNRRPSPYHGDALPTELQRHIRLQSALPEPKLERRQQNLQTQNILIFFMNVFNS